jgi:glycine betaine catabolism B
VRFETRISDIITRTPNVKSIRFPRPPSFTYKPGQFMFVTIRNDGGELQKHFTISSSPTEKEFMELTKKLTGHPFSNALEKLRVGDWAKIDAPYGDFTFSGEFKNVGMLTGGIGITPLRSMCRYCTDLNLNCEITLIYSNHSEKDIIFREELESMQKQNRNLKVVFTTNEHSADWNGYTGRIDADMIKKEIPDYLETRFYTCGPPSMVEAMKNLLKDIKVKKEHIQKEDFPGY